MPNYGVHVIQRRTDALRSYVVEATSELVLPNSATYRANTVPGRHGAFPEFMYGFHSKTGGFGFDAGVMYKDGVYWIFYGPNSKTGEWKEQKISAAKMGSTLTFNARLYTNGVSITATVAGGGSASLGGEIYSAAYTELKKGCNFVRELCIAINPEDNDSCLVPTGAGFTFASFKKTDLKMADGTIATLKSSNSTFAKNIFDSGTPNTTYSGGSSIEDVYNYVNDTAYGSI
jgi:hypothetical protein